MLSVSKLTRTWKVSIGTLQHQRLILDCTNDAFMADAFFKKPEYHIRFALADVERMMSEENSEFLVASASEGEEAPDAIVGSLYLKWFVKTDGSITGKFSAVSVPTRYEKQGIGKALVSAAEARVLAVSSALPPLSHPRRVEMEMGVINLREDLFPWYMSQGYHVEGEIRPVEPDIKLISLDDLNVCSVLMKKVLQE